MIGKEKEVIKKIKSKGFWEINIHADIHNPQRIEKQKLKEIVSKSFVQLRGWDYPHFRDSEGEPYYISNGISKTIDWSYHIEFWRMTQSVNFIHLLALREDWMEENRLQAIKQQLWESWEGKWIGIFSTLYTLTEIFEFTKRLARQELFNNNIIIEIKLHDLEERRLVVDSSNKASFLFPQIAKTNEIWICREVISTKEILTKSSELALNAFKDLVCLFGWENPSMDNLKNDQQKFLDGRL